ncbi:hypothetical protein JVU11DRAFT_3401 [Chiua virens]|nr:hypothetical protein JVU11DRAFT_3401 [Chiua virens]
MPSMLPNATSNIRFSTEPKRALLTPSASPSVGPPDRPSTKRPRHRSTPSSSISATPSTSNESTSSAEVNSARRASTLRVLNVWAQLAERYNKRLDEDDIVDLYSGAIIKDRGVVKGASRDYHIGHFGQPDGEQDYPDADQDQEDSEQDDDDGELGALPPSETVTDDDAPISKTELLRGVPPLSATTDAEDLREFLEAEKQRRVDEEDEDEMSPERLAALRKVLRERAQQKEAVSAERAQEAPSAENPQEGDVDATPTRPSTCVQLSNDESEDELAAWTHDESTAVYPVARDESEQDVLEVAQEIIELTDAETDSDDEFEALLKHPPSFARASPIPVPQPKKETQQLLRSPPDSERGRSKSRARSHSRKRSTDEATSKSENRPRSPLVLRKPEVILTQKRQMSLSKKLDTPISEDEKSDQEVVSHTFPMHKGKGKEVSPSVEDNHPERIAKPHGVVSRGRKRKRIASSSTSGDQLAQSPAEPTLSIFSSPNQGLPATPHSGHPPPPLDPTQAQQAHYLLAQAMHHLSYLLSVTMPSYSPYTPNSSQPWQPPPHTTYSTPVHHPPRPYHTPSSSISRSGLTSSSPVRSSVSPPPIEDQRARSRGRSRSRGRRVSFRLDREEVRLEGRTSPSHEVARGRTPGPPNRKKLDTPRGRSLSRR